MPLTVGDLRIYLRDKNRQATTPRIERLYNKFINDANFALHEGGEWDFDQRYVDLYFLGRYATGTIQVVSNSAAIVGTGTNWIAGTNVIADEFSMRINGEANYYTVSAVGGVGAITLAQVYRGSSLAGLSYALTHDRITLDPTVRTILGVQSPQFPSPLEPANSVSDINWLKNYSQEIGYPRVYALDASEASGVDKKYLWMYPAPNAPVLVRAFYLKWPDEITDATLDTVKFAIPLVAEVPLKQLALAYLNQEQEGTPNVNQITNARQELIQTLSSHRLRSQGIQRQYAQLSLMASGINPLTASAAPGEPQYI